MRNATFKNSTLLTIVLKVTILFSSNTFACDIHGKSGIVADNNLSIPVGLKALVSTGITEVAFNKVIDKVTKIYAPIVKLKGGNLSVVKKWTDGTVNAYAHRDGSNWYVSMFGGLARHPEMTEDAFATVVCHELGHQIGGAPKKVDPTAGSSWASNEGQADYFATLKCLRKVFASERNVDVVKKLKVPANIAKMCTNNFSNSEEAAVCIRTSVAGLALGNFFRVLSGSKTPLSISTPDKKVVKVTFDSHPDSQCRLDTYYQGSMCDKSVSEDVSDRDENIGTCTKRNGDAIGNRPLCWFKPSV
jgi:hypothetical protein